MANFKAARSARLKAILCLPIFDQFNLQQSDDLSSLARLVAQAASGAEGDEFAVLVRDTNAENLMFAS